MDYHMTDIIPLLPIPQPMGRYPIRSPVPNVKVAVNTAKGG